MLTSTALVNSVGHKNKKGKKAGREICWREEWIQWECKGEESIMEVVKTTGHMILMQKLSKNKQILKMKNVIDTRTIL